MITGTYNAYFYHVYSDDSIIYTAGNSPCDSQAYVNPVEGVGLEQMKKFCQSTCEELAAERAEVCGEVSFDDAGLPE